MCLVFWSSPDGNRRTVSGFHCFIALLCMVMAGVCAAAENDPAGTPYTEECARGEWFLKKNQPDSAFNCFLRAYSKGMPAESLYYFWGQIYFGKRALDSALALNFSITGSGDEKFRIRVLGQRRAIYNALGWEKEERAVGDSLMKYRVYRRKYLVPGIGLNAAAGYGKESSLPAGGYPWGTVLDDAEKIAPGFHYNAGSRLIWNVPFASGNKLGAHLRVGIDKPYWTGGHFEDMDSLNLFGGWGVNLADLFGRVSVGYEGTWKQYYSDTEILRHSVNATCYRYSSAALYFLMAGYGVDLEIGDDIDNQSAVIAGYGELFMKGSRSLSLFLSGSGYFADPIRDSLGAYRIYYADIGVSPGVSPETTIVYYTDETFSRPINSDDYPLPPVYHLAVIDAHDERYLFITAPQSRIFASVNVTWKTKIMKRLPAAVTLGWQGCRYLDEYEWHSTGDLPAAAAAGYYFVKNRNDGKYYLIHGDNQWSSFEHIAGAVSLAERRSRRFDNTAALKGVVSKEFRRAGTVALRGAVSRTWISSDLPLPVVIPRWDWTVSLNWSKNIRPRQ